MIAPEPKTESFPAIGDYAFLSDCETSALVAPDGSVEWLCLPRFDSESIFAALLDRTAGSFRFAPAARVPVARRYLPGTNVLETTWATESGWLVVREALSIGAWSERARGRYTRTPGKYAAEQTLVRVAECVQGTVEVELECRPRPRYATRNADWMGEAAGSVAFFEDGGLRVELTSDLGLDYEDNVVRGRRSLADGERAFCALAWGREPDGARDVDDACARIDATGEFWRDWLSTGRFPDHPWRPHLQRSALVLKGLIHAPTGATVAAPTTSLPETPGGERNWDYRFTWIRDATFTLWGLHVLGLDFEAHDFAEFVAEICLGQGRDLQIMYGIGGETELTETTLDHLSGYRGARPVRVGNAAHDQRQNDVYGALLDSLYIHLKTRREPPEWTRDLVTEHAEAAAEIWDRPDQGIWEARGEPKHYVSSKLMCWVALDRASRLARDWDPEQAHGWAELAGAVKADVLARGVSERGVLRQHYETDALDASTLLAPLVRFLPPDHAVVRATVEAIADELTERGLVLRYRVEETDDGLTGVEGAFTICSFWLVSALSEIGERKRARALCESLLRYGGQLGLFAEEIEPATATHLGNFPQAFTHLALINAVSHVIRDELRPKAEGRGGFEEMRGLR